MPNVKAGDIARVVGPGQHPMALVSVDAQCPNEKDFLGPGQLGPIWHCTTLSTVFGYDDLFGRPVNVPPGFSMHIQDKHLRPLHDGDGEDESLRITGKPKPTVLELVRTATHTLEAAQRRVFNQGKA